MSRGGALFGVETEFGLSPFNPGGALADRGRFGVELIHAVARRWPAVQGGLTFDYFLGNGARLYLDCNHPEYASPECSDPDELVACTRAGQLILEQAAREVEERHALEILLFRCNTDGHEPGVAWGAHENYMHVKPQGIVARNLVSHLVTRTIFTGAGGLDVSSPGVSFMLAPRARMITKHAFTHTTSRERGIVHIRDEPLASPGSKRFHVTCGETLCSQWADSLRVGTTALIIALVDAGYECGVPVTLANPVAALHTVARDVSCKAPLTLSNGRQLTAIAVQRHYLSCVRDQLGRPFMPPWAERLCARWAETLDNLETDPAAQWPRLDWPLKLKTFRDWTARRDFDPDLLDALSRDLQPLLDPLGPVDPTQQILELPDPGVTVSGGRRGRAQLAKRLRALRAELLEIDVRFGQLGPRGIFNALDTAGLLAHRVIDASCIERAMTHPPSRSRAHQRGRLIRRLAGQTGITADWTRVTDPVRKRAMFLGDPHGRVRPRWRPLGEPFVPSLEESLPW